MDAPELSSTPLDDSSARASGRRFWERPDPFFGIAVAASVGILAADFLDLAAVTGLGGFLLAALAWALRPGVALCWVAVVAGFAALHGFNLHDVPADTLSRALVHGPSHQVQATGAVLDEPHVSAAGATARFTLGLDRIEVDGVSWPSHARVITYWKNGAPQAGDRLQLIGAARNIPAPRNPGEFDFADYQRRQGILSEIRCSGITDVRLLAHAERGGLRQTAARFHDWMADSLKLGLAPGSRAGAIISTMLLGLRDDPGLGDLEELFQRTGTLHYFAIDGLKLALLSCLALLLLERLGVPRGWARTLSLPPLVFYAMATGLGPASLRAVVMAAILLGAFWLERPVRPLNSLGAAAAGILFFDSNQLFELGFQLTFLVVFAIIALVGPLHRRLLTLGAPDPFLPPRLFTPVQRWTEVTRVWGWGLVSVSLVAWLGSLPIMILRFHVVSPISPLANVVTFPMAWAVLALGVAALSAAAVGLLIPGGVGLAILVNRGNVLAAKLFLGAAQMFDAAPGASFYVTAPSLWEVGQAPAAEITVLDLGVARAIHLRAGGADWLIDTGQPAEYRRSVLPYLHARGVNRLDGLLFSQADNRHLGAASLATADFRSRRVLDSTLLPGRSPRRQEFLRSLGELRKPEVLAQGAAVSLPGGAGLRALYPPPGLKSGASADRALVLQLRTGPWRVLLMANGGATVERWLLANVLAAELRSDVIITGASPDEAWSEFQQVTQPRVVVSQALGAEAERPAQLFQTSHGGAVTLRFWADHFEASGFANDAPALFAK